MSDVKLSPKARAVKLGLYKHYKGKTYRVLGVAIHSETLEEVVLYQALYAKELTWVRPLAIFGETVDVNGKPEPRFRYLGKV